MTEQTKEALSPFEDHQDNAAWSAGFDHGTALGVVLIQTPIREDSVGDRLRDLESKATMRTAIGQCAECGSTTALEFPPRLPGRPTLWLCRADLDKLLRVYPPFPGSDDDAPDPRDEDIPMWTAGLLTGLALSAPMAALPSGDDGEARWAFWERLAWRVRHETCSLCPGLINTWGGGAGGIVRVCYRCREHLRERRALLEWTTTGEVRGVDWCPECGSDMETPGRLCGECAEYVGEVPAP